jgi:hypothetical protein
MHQQRSKLGCAPGSNIPTEANQVGIMNEQSCKRVTPVRLTCR